MADPGDGADDLVTIRLVGLPVKTHVRSTEHSDELMREFTYLRAQATDEDAPNVPARLLDLVDELTGQFSGFTAGTQAELDEAIAGGVETIDLDYRVPATVGPACVHLADLLEQADQYCRAGEHLLTLATPEDIVDYRTWFLDEFVRQAAGEVPRPWAAR